MGLSSSGSFDNLTAFLKRMSDNSVFASLDAAGQRGIAALASATPVDTGITAESWTYEVVHKNGVHSLTFYNTHRVSGRPIAILIQYGHGTGTGGYVQGRDYINPVIRPIFDRVVQDVMKAVNK